ncbi:MAG: hydroxyacid dehydrogenase [Candidatus Zixiibacteriota bacterium]|nr:MAG: hydroxyacid dehydrogenase [candidate division Zixibacteria bacterium]
MTLRVHLSGSQKADFLDCLKAALTPEIVLTSGEDLPDPAEYEVLVCGVPDQKSIEASSNLKHLIIPWAGLPRKTRDLMVNYPHLTVHNIHHNALPVAEMAVTMMMALAKNLAKIDSAMRKHDWSLRYESGIIRLLAGKRALILGYGAVGKQIAVRCLALGMKVSAVGRRGKEAEDGVELHPSSRLETLLPEADLLFLSLPLTEQTKGMIGERQLALLPVGAALINVSRGGIVDEQALYRSLRSGRIMAGLDVWYNYPGGEMPRSTTPPSKYPFHELPNVIMTPHLAGHSDRTEQLRAEELARVLRVALEQGVPPNRVELARGY